MKHKSYLILLSLFFLAAACEKGFEDINQNPFFPTQTDVGPLFNKVISTLTLNWDEQFYLHNDTYYAITQQAALSSRFSEINTNGTEGVWGNYYTALVHIRELERRYAEYEGEAEALNNVQAMLKTILAYHTFKLSDQFGDIPFFDAGKGFEGLENIRPKFDSQEAIYKFLLEELAWVDKNINTFPNPETASGQPYISLGDFDTFLKGDMLLWRKFANSLRLRHAMRMVEKDAAFAEPILLEIIENDLPIIDKNDEPIAMRPREQNWLKQSTHWSFREHQNLRMGTTVWNWLSENDNTDGSGIFDPRAYIFFETNNADEWTPYPQIPNSDTPPIGGTPYGGQRSSNFTLKGNANIYSPIHYYLIRDELDIPELILTPAEGFFIKAEAYARGLGVAQDEATAGEIYTEGVVASITMWQNIVVNTEIWENPPTILSVTDIFGVVNHPRISAFSNDNVLELIYAQRWLDAFRQPWEAFALARRTQQTPREGDFPAYYRNTYPPSEAENNPDQWAEQAAKMGGDAVDVKVWWML